MDSPIFQSAVTSVPTGYPNSKVRLDDVSHFAKVVVKAGSGSNASMQLRGVEIGHSTDRMGALICAVRTNEWMMLGERDAVIVAVSDLDTSGHTAVTDVSHGRSVLRLSGTSSVPVLSKLCSLDLTDLMMPEGAVATSTVAQIRCDIIREVAQSRAETPHLDVSERSYLLSIDSSYGQFFVDAVADAMAEFA